MVIQNKLSLEEFSLAAIKRCIRALVIFVSVLCSPLLYAEDDSDLIGVYVGEQPGAYLQNQVSSKTAIMFSAYSVNSSYWISGDVKYYLGDYSDSMYLVGGITHGKEEGLPSETIYRAGAGWEVRTERRMVYGIGATAWWSEAWLEPVVRGGIYIAYFR